ncbi:AI-2E family transporter [Benzoatithermus flavus]|uniref:AI-2E family transporter n=1 Tax=Benzoatithermus flavus TaxID=3108223 RepID=A0ABU8XZ36_9PROT
MSDTTTQPADLMVSRVAVEAVVRVGLLLLLTFWCFTIAKPFLVPVVWGTLIAVAIHPVHHRLRHDLGDRDRLAAFLVSFLLLILLILPLVVLSRALVDNVASLARVLAEGGIALPPPPEGLAGWPVIGPPLDEFWRLALDNLRTALGQVTPQLKVLAGWLVSLVAGAGFGILNFLIAIVIAGILLVHVREAGGFAQAVSVRLVGSRGPELVELTERTVRSVARGILGTAIVQSMLAGIGFVAVHVPGAAFLTLICFLLCIVQIGPAIVLLGAVIWVFSTATLPAALLFLVWCLFVALLDNVLKPYLMARGGGVPLAVVFVGAIGGLLAHGLIGLFVGPVVFALGFRLFQAWIAGPEAAVAASRQAEPSASPPTGRTGPTPVRGRRS